MIRSGSLFFVVILTLIIGFICSSLVFVSFLHNRQIDSNRLTGRLILNANSGKNILLASDEDYSNGKSIDIFSSGEDSVYLKSFHWGIFEVGISRSFKKDHFFRKIFLYGYTPDRNNSAVYLADLNRPLTLAGNTKITGTCYLPQAGVQRGYIEGRSFTGKNLIAGNIKKSESNVPALNKKMLEAILSYRNFSSDSGRCEIVYEIGDSLVRSFDQRTCFFFSRDKIDLSGKVLKGNVIVCSEKSIEVSPSSVIEDVILTAPFINIQNYSKLTVQAFATDSLKCGDRCKFLYPSSLGLIKDDIKVRQPFIQMGEETSFKGIIFSAQDFFDLDKTKIIIHKKSEVEGFVFSDGFVDFRGNIKGGITCNKFILKTPSSIYENHLLDVSIDHTLLSSHFVGSGLIYSTKEKSLVKWLF